MSYEYNDNFFIEDKIEYGLAEIISERVGNHYINNRHQDKMRIIKLIAGLNSSQEVFDAVIRNEYHSNIDLMIKYYAKKESLPIEFIDVAKSKKSIQILLKSYLQKNGFLLNEVLINEIYELVEVINSNIFNSIIYDRVAEVQNFIHNKIQEKNGTDSHKNLNKYEIKNILSAIRLHLNLQDLKIKDVSKIISNLDKNDEAIQNEYNSPSIIELEKTKKFIPIWKARNMRLLSDYLPSVEKKLIEITDIDKNISLRDYKNEVVETYN